MDFNEDTILTIKVNKKEISEILTHQKDKIIHHPRIPSIIDTNKSYKTFKIENPPPNTLLITIKEEIEGYKSTTYKIIYNHLECNFYNYGELLIPCKLPRSFQIIGSILHLNLEDHQYKFKKEIGELYLKKYKFIKTVVDKTDKIQNPFRNAELEIIAGINSLCTIHKEMGYKYFIDYENCYWNSKLQNERKELLEYFKKGQVVCDVFCGVGPVVIPAIKKGCILYANDLNGIAIECLKINLKINNIKDNCKYYNFDGKEFIQWINKIIIVDHFIMNLPEYSLSFIKYIKGHKPSTLIHSYFFCKKNVDVKEYLFNILNINIDDKYLKIVRNVSPCKLMYKLTIPVGLLLG